MQQRVEWVREDSGTLKAEVPGKNVVWAPQPGSQYDFLRCPVPEVLLEGNRGGGKTDALLMDFGQHVGKGFGAEWRGILFRQTFPQLEDVVAKSKKWFPQIWRGATFNASDYYWGWPTGERLYFRHMLREDDYWKYHGHNYPWIGWEELTTWATDGCYRKMFSTWRSPHPYVPRKVRSTTNPYGPGHNWVKRRFNLPIPPGRRAGRLIEEEGLPPRIAIHSTLAENEVFTSADPNYRRNLLAAARNVAEKKAWLEGSWDIVAGGMFDDLWEPRYHVMPPLVRHIPDDWRIDRSFDWGSSKPFSVGWWAQSNGSDLQLPNGKIISTVRGDLFRILEWYGSTGEPNEGLRMLATDVAKGIVERELAHGLHGRVKPGPADTSIWTVENGHSLAADMRKPVRVGTKQYPGVQWTRADKGKGSRKTGWEQLRQRLGAALPPEYGPREYPGLFVCENCEDFIRTVPVLPRDLNKDPDDANTNAEDHIADETRYRVRETGKRARGARALGVPS